MAYCLCCLKFYEKSVEVLVFSLPATVFKIFEKLNNMSSRFRVFAPKNTDIIGTRIDIAKIIPFSELGFQIDPETGPTSIIERNV